MYVVACMDVVLYVYCSMHHKLTELVGVLQVFAGAQVVLVASVGPNGPDGLPPRGVVVFRFGDAAPQVLFALR